MAVFYAIIQTFWMLIVLAIVTIFGLIIWVQSKHMSAAGGTQVGQVVRVEHTHRVEVTHRLDSSLPVTPAWRQVLMRAPHGPEIVDAEIVEPRGLPRGGGG